MKMEEVKKKENDSPQVKSTAAKGEDFFVGRGFLRFLSLFTVASTRFRSAS